MATEDSRSTGRLGDMATWRHNCRLVGRAGGGVFVRQTLLGLEHHHVERCVSDTGTKEEVVNVSHRPNGGL